MEKESAQQVINNSTMSTAGSSSTPECNIDENLGDQLAILQKMYKQKHAELLAKMQNQAQNLSASDYLQILQNIQQQAPQVISQNVTPATVASTHHPYLGAIHQNSSEQSTDEIDIQQLGIACSKENVSVGAAPTSRNRRAYSGSGQTISQTTRDRLKIMIASKKQKLHSSSSTGSASNVSLNSTSNFTSSTWIPPTKITNSELNLGQISSNSLPHHKNSCGSNIPVSSNHFEPYPSPVTCIANAVTSSDFQLRKVNSEPNLKMRIRARLLNKGSSPVTTGLPTSSAQLPSGSNNSMSHSIIQRSDSDSTPLEMFIKNPTVERFQQAAQSLSSTSSLGLPANMMIPSPSLPNLCNGMDNIQIDYANLMMQASFASFLSMPSLLKNQLFQPSMMESLSDSSASSSFNNPNRSTVKFDNRTFSSPLPIGGYPSLLKQQLRDLVLRRKSLVREEPEDDNLNQRWQNLTQNNHLKTGLAYDVAMSKHACLCGENHNHVEHGGRVQSIWSRLIESGLLNKCERVPVRKANLDLLRLCHSQTYVTFFGLSPTACLKLDTSEMPLKSFVQLPCGGIGVDTDTYFNDASTQLAIRIAIGLLVELASQVVDGKLQNGFACIRPPGHHAEREQAMGFCFFNNVSITVKHLQQRYGEICPRMAIIDWDVHHGNGTQLYFESDPNVLYISLHRHDNGNFFPGTGAVTEVGAGEGKGFTVNIPFSGGIMGDAEYLAAWRVLVLPLLDAFKPSFIIVSCGFDASQGHPAALGGYELSPQIFGYLTRSLMSFANGRLVLALEGGYDLPSICESAEECVKALLAEGGEINRLRPEILEQIPNQSAQETIQKVIAVHKKHWPSLTGVQGINTSELHWQTISQRFSSLTVQS